MKKLMLLTGLGIMLLTGCKKNSTESIVSEEPPKPVSAAFKMSTDNLFENQDVVLTPDDNRAGNTYFWDFGLINNKHVVSDQKIPVMNIKSHGNYYVTLTVTDSKGNSATSTQFMPVLCSWNGIGVHPPS